MNDFLTIDILCVIMPVRRQQLYISEENSNSELDFSPRLFRLLPSLNVILKPTSDLPGLNFQSFFSTG